MRDEASMVLCGPAVNSTRGARRGELAAGAACAGEGMTRLEIRCFLPTTARRVSFFGAKATQKHLTEESGLGGGFTKREEKR